VHPFVQSRLPQVIELCRRHHVKRLDLFGSAATDRFNPATSDVDFAVEYLPDVRRGLGGDYFALKAGLAQVYEREIDLVALQAVRNPFFRDEVIETRVPVYET
jgi:predicted nucleotidyltransferase